MMIKPGIAMALMMSVFIATGDVSLACDAMLHQTQPKQPHAHQQHNDTTGMLNEPGAVFSQQIEGLLTALKETSYQATTDINPETGMVKCDCSGLVGYVLRHTFPEAYVSLRGDEAAWRKRPVSVTFYETFLAAGEQGKGTWCRIRRLEDAVPGDILAWRKQSLKAGSTTGHTCMIASRPVVIGEGQVRVRLIDSTRAPHEHDTRPVGTFGMGAGYKTFLVDAKGECIGYVKGDHTVMSMIAIGRLRQSPQTTTHQEDFVYIGLTTDKAIQLAERNNHQWRVIREDGIPKPVKWLIENERLNFVVTEGKIVEVYRG